MLSKFLRAAGRLPIEFVSGVIGTPLSTTTSVTFSGHRVGDFLFAWGGSQSTTPPTFSAGWTLITSLGGTSGAGTSRAITLVYKVATTTASEVITFTGSGSSAISYSAGYTFRNVAQVGNSNTVFNLIGGTSYASPSLTLSRTNGTSALILCTYSATMTAAPGGLIINSGMAYGLNQSSWGGGNLTVSGNNAALAAICELVAN